MIRINQIKLNPNHSENDMVFEIRKKLRLKKDSFTYTIEKCSIDGRNKPYIKYIYSVDVSIKNLDLEQEKELIKKLNDNNIMFTENTTYTFLQCRKDLSGKKIVITGSGPAGLFCAFMLAKAGAKPVVLERGSCVEVRKEKVEAFWKGGELDTECNVQFGEGGAGTFSDGKLNTQIKDSSGRIRKVLEIFVEHGAPKEILYSNKPHVGTDILADVVKNMRNAIIACGGEILFDNKMTDICVRDGVRRQIEAVMVNDSRKNEVKRIPCDFLVLAPGHSARDTFEMLLKRGIEMIPKAFAVGVRMEHPQEMIDEYAYGENIYELLPASYKITHKAKQERGVYSFCMCPGGYVVNASSEKDRLCINGMSYSARDSRNANSAIVVTVNPKDYGLDSPLAGIEFQRKLETLAFVEGKGKIPCQTYGSFKNNTECREFGEVLPCTKGETRIGNLHNVLPQYVCDTIIEGVESFGKQIPGFDREDAVLLAVESRTSSPVRIVRDDDMMSNVWGIIPCGEGAGYAGGIISAAVDGIRAAENIARVIEDM